MRIVVHGQQAFGKAVLEALLKRGDDVVAVYAAPEKPGQGADPVSPLAAAKVPRPERHQLADHPGRDRNRTVDLLARQRPRYRRRAVTEDDTDRLRGLAWLGLFRSPVPDRGRRDAGIGRPRQSR